MSDEYRKTVDIGGSLAYIFVHWKAVLIAALVCAIAVGGYAYTQKKNAPVVSELSSEEQIEKARAKLPEPEALYVEQLFGQYQRYLKELNSWNSYLDRSMVLQLDPGDYVKQVIQYSVKANSPSAVLAFNKSLLGQDEYRRLAAAYGEGAEADSISELVVFEDVGSSRTQGSAQASNAAPASSVVSEDEGTNGEENSFQGVFSFSLLAQDEQKAAAMEAEMDKIIAEKVRALTAGENSSEVSKVSSVTTRNEAGYLLAMQQALFATNISLQSNRSAFIKNTIDTLSEGNKSYFDLLVKSSVIDETAENSTPVVKNKISVKKYAAAGCALGLLLSVAVLFLLFVCRDRIRTESEIEDNLRLPVLQTLKIARKTVKADFIKNIGVRCMQKNRAKDLSRESLAALTAETCRRLEKLGARSLYIASESSNKAVISAIEELADLLERSGISIALRSPMSHSTDYREFLKADAVLTVEELNKSKKSCLKDLISVCKRNQLPIIGCAVFADANNY